MSTTCYSAPPSRDNTYTSRETILAADVTANEDAIFNYLQAGVDTIADGTIVNADVSGSANIQSNKLNLTAITQNIVNTGTIANTGNVTVTGTLNATTIQQGGAALVPQGMIMLWSGAISAMPTGWELCDGSCTISCPDLTDRFVIHADADSGGTNDVDDTGGASTITLTSAQSGVPAHTHTVAGDTASGSSNTSFRFGSGGTAGSVTSVANATANAASAHSNRDKFYALAYVIKN